MLSDDLITILGGLSAAVVLVSAERRIVFANHVARERFGRDIEGRDIVRAVRHPDCLKALENILNGALQANAVMVVEAPVRVTLQISVTGFHENKPAGASAAVCFEDISHVLEAEQMRSDFVANVSHELRSPLTSLAGFIETLQGSARDDEAARVRFLDLMESEAQRMSRLISDLLSLSKVEANERVRPLGQVDVTALVQGVVDILQPQAQKETKAIEFQFPTATPQILGDRDELVQVFQNLIENALKYGAAGSEVNVNIQKLESAPGFSGAALSVSVQDQGEGIAAHHIPRLTERFYRVDTSRSRDMGGTGLGLAIVKHIINRHRGRLQIKSGVGTGSTFSVLLPIADPIA